MRTEALGPQPPAPLLTWNDPGCCSILQIGFSSLHAGFGDSHQMAGTSFYSNSLTSCHPTIKKTFNCFFSSHPIWAACIHHTTNLQPELERVGTARCGCLRAREHPGGPWIAWRNFLGGEYRTFSPQWLPSRLREACGFAGDAPQRWPRVSFTYQLRLRPDRSKEDSKSHN